jgi:hypothetical protein
MNQCDSVDQNDTVTSNCNLLGAAQASKFKSAIVAPEKQIEWLNFIDLIEDREKKHPGNQYEASDIVKIALGLMNKEDTEFCLDNTMAKTTSMALTSNNSNCLLFAKSSSYDPQNPNRFFYKHLWISTSYFADDGSVSETPPTYYKIKSNVPSKLIWIQYRTLPSGRKVEIGRLQLQGYAVWDWHSTSTSSNQEVSEADGESLLPMVATNLTCPNDVLLELRPKNSTKYVYMP